MISCKSIVLVLSVALHTVVEARTEIDLEFGLQESPFHGVRAPTDEGTQMELVELQPALSFRMYTTFEYSNDYGLRLGYAPMRQIFKETYEQNVEFNDKTFAANQEIKITQDTDRYSLGFFKILPGWFDDEVLPRIGFMLQGESLSVGLSSSGQTESVDLFVFRPLFYFSADWILSEKFFARVDFDGWDDGQIRRLDGAWMIMYSGFLWNFGIGYRFVEDFRELPDVRMGARVDLLTLKAGMWL